MSEIRAGMEIKFCRWNAVTEEHDDFPALCRVVLGGAQGDVHLTYFEGNADTDENGVHNIEFWPSSEGLVGNDHWRRNIESPNWADSQPLHSPRPEVGQLIWLFRFVDGEPADVMAVVRSVLGSPSDPAPTINCYYVNDAGQKTNVQQVQAYDAGTHPRTEDYWAARRFKPGDEESAGE